MTLGTARLTPPALLSRLRDGKPSSKTVNDFRRRAGTHGVAAGRSWPGPRYAVRWPCRSTTPYAVLRIGAAAVRRHGGRDPARRGVDGYHPDATSPPSDRPHRGPGPRDPVSRASANVCRARASRTEIGRLVDTLNDMLARIEGSFEVQRRFTADAAHELQSPLSRLRDGARGAPCAGAATRASTKRPCARVSRRSSGSRSSRRKLLTLARLDAEQGRPAPAQVVRLSAPCSKARSGGSRAKLKSAASPSPLHPSQALSLSVRCGEGLADLVFTNVLDNAVKFCRRAAGWWSMPRPKARGGRRGLRRGAGDPGRGDLSGVRALLPRTQREGQRADGLRPGAGDLRGRGQAARWPDVGRERAGLRRDRSRAISGGGVARRLRAPSRGQPVDRRQRDQGQEQGRDAARPRRRWRADAGCRSRCRAPAPPASCRASRRRSASGSAGTACERAADDRPRPAASQASTRRRFTSEMMQHAAHDGDAEQRDEADRRRHAQVDVA